ncbi:MAG: ComEC/Rec2 family competence protein [Lachnoclostridium sp.]|nr:ComEC/Rec2 family competence protein [Lachnoclostridium sp.]
MASLRRSLEATPLLLPGVAFAAGTLACYLADSEWIVIALAVVVLTLFLLRQSYFTIIAVAAAAGYVNMHFHIVSLPENLIGERTVYSGVVLGSHETESVRIMVVEVDTVAGVACRPMKISVSNWSMFPAIYRDDRIEFKCTLQPLDPAPDLPDEWDTDEMLRRNGIVGKTVIDDKDVVKVTPTEGVMVSLRRFCDSVRSYIMESDMSQYSRQLLTAMITGDREYLHPDTRSLFSQSGIAHVLALSGMHVAILALLLSILLLPLRVYGLELLRRLIIVGALWIFAIMTGLSPSVLRAVIMATMLAGTRLLQRYPTPVNSISLASMLILLFDPWSLMTVGFQLSFGAVLAIVCLAERINPFPRGGIGHYLASYPAVTLAAMIGTGVVSAYYFNMFPTWFLLANIPVAIILPPFVGCGVLLMVLKTIGLPYDSVTVVVDAMGGWISDIVDSVSRMPFPVVDGVFIDYISVILYIAVVITAGMWVNEYGRKWFYVSVVLLAGVIVTKLAEPEVTTARLYVPRHAYYTSIYVPQQDRLMVFTTASENQQDEIRQACGNRYRRFMQRRGLKELTITKVSAGQTLTIGDSKILLVDQSVKIQGDHAAPDHLVICRGYAGDIDEIAARYPDARIYLSRDLNKKLHDKYQRRLHDIGVNVVSLRDGPLIL